MLSLVLVELPNKVIISVIISVIKLIKSKLMTSMILGFPPAQVNVTSTSVQAPSRTAFHPVV